MKLNARDLFTLAEAVACNEKGQTPYDPKAGCYTAAKRLVRLQLFIHNEQTDQFLPTQRGFEVVTFLCNVVPLVPPSTVY